MNKSSEQSGDDKPGLIKIPQIRMKPILYKSFPEQDICLICQDKFENGDRITICDQCHLYLHYKCQLKWIYLYNPVWNRICCHCRENWHTDYSTIQIINKYFA